jgi:hypothetical protein
MYNQLYHKFNSFYNHKFAFHITGPRQDAFDAVLRLRPKVVKTLDFSVDVMKNFKQEIPDLFLIGRLFVHPQDFGQLSGGTAQIARERGLEMAERILREEVNRDIHHLNGKPIFNAWESLNEVFPEHTDPETQKLYEDYQVAFGEKMLAEGFEPIAFNFSQGNGRGQQWLALYPGTLETYRYLGFHEYDWPEMDRLHQTGLNGPSEPENLVPGVGEGRGNDGMWRCLRYRRIMNEGIRQAYGDKHVCLVTECGMTQGVWGGHSGDLGPWAQECTVPRDIPGGVGTTPISVDDYWQTLLWYNSEIIKDDYLMGACLFVTGASGLPEWETFEHLGPIMERIYAFQTEVGFEDLPTQAETPIATGAPATTNQPATVVRPPTSPPSRPAAPPSSPPTPMPTTQTPADRLSEAIPSSGPQWKYILEVSQGLGLLVGDIGLADILITITKPDGTVDRVTSGHKPEFGLGGFETYAQVAGSYKVQFLDQSFDLSLNGQFTRVTFEQNVGAESVRVSFTLRDNRSTYPVREKIFTKIEVTNISDQVISFGIMGLLSETRHFQTSWTDGSIDPGATFRHEDGLAFDTPGAHNIQLSICFARRESCTSGQAEESWVRFEPLLAVIVR